MLYNKFIVGIQVILIVVARAPASNSAIDFIIITIIIIRVAFSFNIKNICIALEKL